MAYPSKSTRTEIPRLANKSVNRNASFYKRPFFHLYYICYLLLYKCFKTDVYYMCFLKVCLLYICQWIVGPVTVGGAPISSPTGLSSPPTLFFFSRGATFAESVLLTRSTLLMSVVGGARPWHVELDSHVYLRRTSSQMSRCHQPGAISQV